MVIHLTPIGKVKEIPILGRLSGRLGNNIGLLLRGFLFVH